MFQSPVRPRATVDPNQNEQLVASFDILTDGKRR
jgi:hypothetical protein